MVIFDKVWSRSAAETSERQFREILMTKQEGGPACGLPSSACRKLFAGAIMQIREISVHIYIHNAPK